MKVPLLFRTIVPDCTQFLADICNNRTCYPREALISFRLSHAAGSASRRFIDARKRSFTARYKPLAFVVRSSAFDRLVSRCDSRILDNVANEHFAYERVLKNIMRVMTATTTAETTKPSSGVAGSSSACYPSQPVAAKFQ